MAAARAPKPRVPRRRWPPAEKRHLVELTLRAGASARAIAREHGVHPNTLGHWKALYRAGRLDGKAPPAPCVRASAERATFVPVSVVPTMRRLPPAGHSDLHAGANSVVQLVFASGATLRIETAALDATLVCALAAELRR